MGLPIRFAAIAGGITVETLGEWREDDPEFGRAFELARLESVKHRWNLIQEAARRADGDWKAAAWSLERAFASDFCRPEFQLNLNQQNNVTENHFTISITVEEYKKIEVEAERSRARVREMFERYRPQLTGNGDQEASSSVSMAVKEKFAKFQPSSGTGE